MKPKRVLESLADLSPEVVKVEPAKPPQASPNPSPASVQQPRGTQLLIRAPEYSDFGGYPHWGLNE